MRLQASASGGAGVRSRRSASKPTPSPGSIRWNAAFRDILESTDDGTLHIDYGKFHEVETLTQEPDTDAGHP